MRDGVLALLRQTVKRSSASESASGHALLLLCPVAPHANNKRTVCKKSRGRPKSPVFARGFRRRMADDLPIETVQVLRNALADKCAEEVARRTIAAMEGGVVANRIIKDEFTDKKLRVLSIARRLKYSFDAPP